MFSKKHYFAIYFSTFCNFFDYFFSNCKYNYTFTNRKQKNYERTKQLKML